MSIDSYVMRVNAQSRLQDLLDEVRVPREGWATLYARPNLRDTGHVLWLDLLNALGHATPFTQGDRQGTAALDHAWAWLAAGATTDLIVVSPADLNRNLLLDLALRVTSAGTRLWLIYTTEPADEREAAIDALGANSETADEFMRIRSASAMRTEAVGVERMERAPDVHFLAFLDTAERLMSAEGFAGSLSLFNEGRDALGHMLSGLAEPSEQDVAGALHEMTVRLTDPSEILAMTRGAQAGALLAGWFLQIDIDRWMRRGSIANLSTHLDQSQWGTVLSLQSPTAAAICTLASLGVSVETMASLPRTSMDLVPKALTVDDHRTTVPEHGLRCLTAQMVLHALVAEKDEPLLTSRFCSQAVNTRTVTNALKSVTRQTGLALRTTGTRRTSDGPWFDRAGVSFRRIA